MDLITNNQHHHPSRRGLAPQILALLALAIALALVCLAPARIARAQGDTTITTSPYPAPVSGCGTVAVQVWINDVTNLYAADARLDFNPALLEVVDFDTVTPGIQIEPGSFLSPDFPIVNTADNTAGYARYAMTQWTPSLPRTGSGVFFTIHFRAKSVGTSSLTFSYHKLSSTGGVEIPAAIVNGSSTTTAPSSPAVAIAKLGASDARMSWGAVGGASSYRIYRSSTPYFTPSDPPYQTTSSLSYDDLGILGNPANNYYYVIRSACATGFASGNSNRVGAFNFALVRGNNNAVSLPLIDSTLTTADQLGAATGALRVSRWVATTQSFDHRLVGISGVNFSLSTGQGYFLYTPGSGPTVFSTVGSVPTQGSISFPITRASTCRLNLLSLPLDQGAIALADSLAGAIGGVPRISQWMAGTNSFMHRIPGFSGTNFATAIGYPYWPCATTSGGGPTWP